MNTHPTFERGSWSESLAATAPFLILGALASLIHLLHLTLPQWLAVFTSFGLFLTPLLLLFVFGLIEGVPRWFLPYAGLVVSFLSLVLAQRLFLGALRPWHPWFVRVVYNKGAVWFGLLGLAAFITLIAATWHPLRPFYVRIRGDWTLLSFGMYGATLLALFLTFDDYPDEEPYVIVASLSLAAGAWVYLRTTHPWRRFLALFIALTLSMLVAATGKAIIFTNTLSRRVPARFTWQAEVLSTVILWGWLAAVVLSPALLGFLPRPAEPWESG
jgi:hypothetical protein